jgi:hypothetical protein
MLNIRRWRFVLTARNIIFSPPATLGLDTEEKVEPLSMECNDALKDP